MTAAWSPGVGAKTDNSEMEPTQHPPSPLGMPPCQRAEPRFRLQGDWNTSVQFWTTTALGAGETTPMAKSAMGPRVQADPCQPVSPCQEVRACTLSLQAVITPVRLYPTPQCTAGDRTNKASSVWVGIVSLWSPEIVTFLRGSTCPVKILHPEAMPPWVRGTLTTTALSRYLIRPRGLSVRALRASSCSTSIALTRLRATTFLTLV